MTDSAIAEFIKVLTGLGLPGVIIAFGGWWIFRLTNRNNELSDKNAAMAAEQAKTSEAMTAAINAQNVTISNLAMNVQRMTDVLVRGGKVTE